MKSQHLVEVVDAPRCVAGSAAPGRAAARTPRDWRVDVEALAGADAVHEQPQRPGRGDPRVLLPQRAGGRVARVGERRLAGLDQRAR